MKRFLLFSAAMMLLMPLKSMAQNDDIYFVPTKKEKTKCVRENNVTRTPVYSVGTERDVDEYNRRTYRSSYVRLDNDSTGDDIIDFDSDSTLPDTLYLYEEESGFGDSDYYYSRMMSRFDDFYGWYPYYYRSRLYWDYPWWRGPYWNYSSFWYDPWYDPWGYGWYGGYNRWWYPYSYYGFYGGYTPWIGWRGHTGTRNHGNIGGHHSTVTDNGNRHFGSHNSHSSRPVNITTGTFGSRRPSSTVRDDRRGNTTFGGSRANGTSRINRSETLNRGTDTHFGNSRSETTENHSYDFGRSSTRSSNYGGSRSGGSFGGGSFGAGSRSGGARVGGGGHFGGRR